jgi:DNA-binding transcriptional ArsR family regulator
MYSRDSILPCVLPVVHPRAPSRIFNRTVDFPPPAPKLRAMQTDDPPGPDPDMNLVFAALADPTRRHLLRMLLDGERRVGDLAAPLPISLAAVSKHLQILGRAGLVSQRAEGRVRTCRLEPDGLAAAFVWMQGFGAFVTEDIATLERLLELALDEDDDGQLRPA